MAYSPTFITYGIDLKIAFGHYPPRLTMLSYQQILKREYVSRTEGNKNYSLRAFSRHLKVDVGDLSKYIRGKKMPSLKSGKQLCEKLDLSQREQNIFLASLVNSKVPGTSTKVSFNFDLPEMLQIDADMFQVIGSLYYYAILEMTFLQNGIRSADEVAKYLGITAVEAHMAIARLMRVGLLKRENGKFIKTERMHTTKDKTITTPAHKKHLRQVLQGAIKSLEKDPISKRSMTSMSMSIDTSKLSSAKEMIEEFTQNLCAYLEDGERTETYELGISLYPLKGSFKL